MCELGHYLLEISVPHIKCTALKYANRSMQCETPNDICRRNCSKASLQIWITEITAQL